MSKKHELSFDATVLGINGVEHCAILETMGSIGDVGVNNDMMLNEGQSVLVHKLLQL